MNLKKAETQDNEPLTQEEVNEIMSGNFYDKLSQVILLMTKAAPCTKDFSPLC